MRALSFLRDGHIMIFHVDVFPPLFFGRFFPPSLWDTVLFRLSSPSPLRKHPLPRIFSEYFLLMHTYTHIYVTDSVFPPLTSYRFSWRFFSPDSTDRIRALFRPPAVPGAAVVGRGVAPSLGYLLLFLTVCPHKQNGGLLFLLLWYGGRVWGTATLGVKGGRRERATTGRRGCLRKCSGVSGNRFWAPFFLLFSEDFCRFQSAEDSGAPLLSQSNTAAFTTAKVESDLFDNNIEKYSF